MRELDCYCINFETLIIIPYGEKKSKVFEIDEDFIVNMTPLNIIKESCLYFGSSFEGRQKGTKNLISCEFKVPVILEDSRNLIFFPSHSYKNKANILVSYNNLLRYSKIDKEKTLFCFKGNNNIKVNVKYNLIDNQIVRCIKLDALINKRKKNDER